jgi:hypothetical protein
MVAPQFFFIRDQTMNRSVAIAADVNRAVHLLAIEPLLEPLVAVQRAGDEVMLGRPALGDATA